MSLWREDARRALVGAFLVQVLSAAASVVHSVQQGRSPGVGGHVGWTVVTGLLLWWLWSRRSRAAQVVLTLLVALPLLMLAAFTLGPLEDLVIPLLMVLGVAELALLWAPSVREHLHPRRTDVPHY